MAILSTTVAGAKFGRLGQGVRKYLDKSVGGQMGLDDQVYAAGQHIMGKRLTSVALQKVSPRQLACEVVRLAMTSSVKKATEV